MNRKWTDLYGNSLILKALDKISKEIDFTAKFIGSGPMLEILRNDYKHLEANGRVQYLPYTSQIGMVQHFKDSWCYVSAAKSDGTSVSLLEAMSAGLICVTSDFPSNLEWIQNEKTGFVFNNSNIESLSDTLRKIYKTERPDLEPISSQARVKASHFGNWSLNKKDFLKATSE